MRLLAVLLLSVACAVPAQADRAAPEAASGVGVVSQARSTQAMVVTANAHATRAAAAMLHEGGSAVDAAIAARGRGRAVPEKRAPIQTRKAAGAFDPSDPATWGKISRNAPCPCGSGKKYKHCHGKYE